MNKYSPEAILKILAKIILGLAAFLVTLIVAVLIWVLVFPKSVWNFSSRYILPKDLTVTWQELHFNSEKIKFLNWQMDFSAHNLVVVKKSPALHTGAVDVQLKFVLNLRKPKEWLEIKSLNIQGQEKSTLVLEEDTEPTPVFSFFQEAESYLSYLNYTHSVAKIDNLNLKVPHFEVQTGKESSLLLQQIHILKSEQSKSPGILYVVGEIENKPLQIKFYAELDNSKIKTEENFLAGNIDIKSLDWAGQTDFTGHYNGEKIAIQAQPSVKIGKSISISNSDSSLRLELIEELADLTLQTNVQGIPGPFKKTENLQIKIQMPLKNDILWADEATSFEIKTGVDLFSASPSMRSQMQKACKCALPKNFQLNSKGHVWLANWMGEEKKKVKLLEAKLNMEQIENALFSANIAAGITVLREKGVLLYEPLMDSEITVHSYQALRKYLDLEGVLIPAPLNVLEGTLKFEAKAPVSQSEKSIQTQVKLLAHLSSEHQKVLVDTTAVLDLAKTLKFLNIDLDVLIRNLRLELPPLDPILGLPPVVNDRRFLQKPKNLSKPSDFQMNIYTKIKTETPGSIQLLSKYTKPYIPVSLAIQATSQAAPTANFKLEPFTLEYLRRKIFVENFKLDMAKDSEVMPIDGRMRMEQAGYKIFLDIGGTTKAPNVVLTSDPDLSQSDIISVLLYGRVNDQLVSGEAETAGSFNAALADRAIGIFGLWAFAVTPIQSFSYNPITKVYMATVKLGKGLTAGVGTNWEQATNLELRKQISSKWVLTASWAPTEENGSGEKLVLRWERRF